MTATQLCNLNLLLKEKGHFADFVKTKAAIQSFSDFILIGYDLEVGKERKLGKFLSLYPVTIEKQK